MLNFLNSTNRSYNGADLNKINEAILGNGVLDTTGSDFEVTKTTGLDVLVKKGSAIITVEQLSQDTNIIGTQNADTTLTCAANATNYIIYRAFQSVITGDTIDTNGTNSDAIEVVTSFPTDPYILLATVNVPDLATSLTDEMIVDNRVFANIKQYMIDEIIETVYANDPLGDIDIYSNGINIQNVEGSDVISNSDDIGIVNLDVFDNLPTYRVKQSWLQKFTAPVSELGSLFLKKGRSDNDENRGITISLYTLDGSELPDTLIESTTIPFSEWDEIGDYQWFEIPLTGTYVASTKYGIKAEIQGSSKPDEEAELSRSNTTDPNVDNIVQWYDTNFGIYPGAEFTTRDYSLSMRLTQRETTDFGTTTRSKISQTFLSTSRGATSITLKKGDDTGTPTGDINCYLYEADVNGEPDGDPISSQLMTEAQWNAIAVDSEFELNLGSGLSLQKSYIFTLEPVNISASNYRSLYSAETNDNYTDGEMKGFNGTSWVNINYDLYFKIKEGSSNKLVQTLPTGYISDELLPPAYKIPPHQMIWQHSGWQSIRERRRYRIATSKSGKYLVNYGGHVTYGTPVSVYEKKGSLYLLINTFTVTGYTEQGIYCFFDDKNEEKLVVAMSNTSTDQARLWYIDHKTETGITYTDTNEVYSVGYISINNTIWVQNGFVYMAYNVDDVYKIDMSNWTLADTHLNIGVNVGSYTYCPTGLDSSGNIVQSNGDVFSYDGEGNATLLLDESADVGYQTQRPTSTYSTFYAPSGVDGVYLRSHTIGYQDDSVYTDFTQIWISPVPMPEY